MSAIEDDIDSAIARYGLDGEGEADNCPTCGLASCIGRFQSADCDHEGDLFVPLTPANPAAPKPKCRRHEWYHGSLDPADPPVTICMRCGTIKNEAASRRGRLNKNRGNAIERELGKKLGMRRVGQFGGKDDLSNDLFSPTTVNGS